jgi:flagellin-like protein
MIKLWKSRKALSPVVAAIILIAVTVAVSIAVAAWMGALTFTFMKTEELKILNITWATGNANATLTVKNTGSGTITINQVKVNDASATMTPSSVTLSPGGQTDIVVSGVTFSSGTKYEFAFYSATGNRYPYTAVAP